MKSLKNRTLRGVWVSGLPGRLMAAVALAGMFSTACDVHSSTAPGTLFSITVTPNTTLNYNATQQFVAIGKDAAGVTVPITPSWAVVAGGGAINGTSGLFTAGTTSGVYMGTVRATSGGMSGTANVTVVAPPPPVIPMGQADLYGILAGTTFTCITGGLIKADVGVWPGSANTGFPPCAITGTQHLGDAVAQTGQGDLTVAYNQLAGMACSPANAMTGIDLGGKTLAPGVYCFTSSAFLNGTLTLAGPSTGSWVFQVATTLITGTNASVVLSGGALARNVYFQVGSSATLEVGTAFQGNILALTSISLKNNATLLGRALARNGGVTLDNNNVITLP